MIQRYFESCLKLKGLLAAAVADWNRGDSSYWVTVPILFEEILARFSTWRVPVIFLGNTRIGAIIYGVIEFNDTQVVPPVVMSSKPPVEFPVNVFPDTATLNLPELPLMIRNPAPLTEFVKVLFATVAQTFCAVPASSDRVKLFGAG